MRDRRALDGLYVTRRPGAVDPTSTGVRATPRRDAAPALRQVPPARVLAGERHTVLLFDDGGGLSNSGQDALTAWGHFESRDVSGLQVYVRDLDTGEFESFTAACRAKPSDAVWMPGVATLECVLLSTLGARLDVAVVSGADAEIRTLTLENRTTAPRHLEVTTYAEVALAPAAAYAAHPAFSKLFVQTEMDSRSMTLLARRRPR